MDLIDIKMPEDQQEGTVSTISSWLKQPGESIKAHDPVVELETDKVNVEIAAPADGILREILKEEGEEVAPGDVVARMSEGSAAAQPQPKAAAAPTPQPSAQSTTVAPAASGATAGKAHLLSPAVRRLFKQHQLTPDMIQGSGKGGRITFADVQGYLASPRAKAPVAQAMAAPSPAISYPSGNIPSTMVPHNAMRRKIASHMVDSLLRTAPHVTSVFEMDMSAVIAHRKAHKADFAAKGVNLTITAYFVQAAVAAIQAVPSVNSRWHDDALEIFQDLNIGVGTALGDKGLIVPVLKQAQHLNLFGVAARLQDMTNKARDGKLSPNDVKDGTFTISNHGVSGSLIATPIIINQPQSAILGIGKCQKRVMVMEVDGNDVMAIKPMCYVTLSIDHRALDAWQTNNFLSHFVQTIEQWS